MSQSMLTSESECIFAPSDEHREGSANGKTFCFKQSDVISWKDTVVVISTSCES